MERLWESRALLLQMGSCAVALLLLILGPPLRGPMLLVPLSGQDGGAAVRVVIARGGGLVGRGPIAGSVIISGDLSRLAMPVVGAGAILLAAPGVGCGEEVR